MSHPTPDQIGNIVLGKRRVYVADVDSRIRELANRLTARAFFELLAPLDDKSPTFGSELSATVGSEPSGVIGFHTSAMCHDNTSDFDEQA